MESEYYRMVISSVTRFHDMSFRRAIFRLFVNDLDDHVLCNRVSSCGVVVLVICDDLDITVHGRKKKIGHSRPEWALLSSSVSKLYSSSNEGKTT
ncbi:hypothetical protein Tco_0209417 [Tanacetum coccineum]